MNAIEFDTIAHNGQVVITIPEAYLEQWNNQAVHVVVTATDKAAEKPKTSLMSALKQIKITALPRHVTQSMRDVWFLQNKFTRTVGSRPFRLLEQPKFRAAYDFLQLRAETGGADPTLVDWWTRFQSADEEQQQKMTTPGKNGPSKPRSKSRRYRPRSKPATPQ